MDDKLKSTLQKIKALADQNPEFANEMRKMFGNTSPAVSVSNSDSRINEIYEYCIEKVIRQQAEDFYKDFPLTTIKTTLIDDFVRMESFRRKDNFGDFCLALYQQIECISNHLCTNSKLSEIAENMWSLPAYVINDINNTPSIDKRISSDYNIAYLVFGKAKAAEKAPKALQSHYALDKIKIIVYFLGFKATMKSSDYDTFFEITNLLYDIYQCRNLNHRGQNQTEWESQTLERILPLKSFYYFQFLGAYAQYINYIKSGFPSIDEILNYARNIPSTEKKPIQLPGPNIIGKIDDPQYSKKSNK